MARASSVSRQVIQIIINTAVIIIIIINTAIIIPTHIVDVISSDLDHLNNLNQDTHEEWDCHCQTETKKFYWKYECEAIQVDPKPSSAFIRGGSVSRGFEMATSRDPFYRWLIIFDMTGTLVEKLMVMITRYNFKCIFFEKIDCIDLELT